MEFIQSMNLIFMLLNETWFVTTSSDRGTVGLEDQNEKRHRIHYNFPSKKLPEADSQVSHKPLL